MIGGQLMTLSDRSPQELFSCREAATALHGDREIWNLVYVIEFVDPDLVSITDAKGCHDIRSTALRNHRTIAGRKGAL